MAGVGLKCCCTPPPNAKELGACCYTEEINGIIFPRCIPSLTEEECSGSTYTNAAFSAGLPCGNTVSCAVDIFDVDGPKAIKQVFTPKSRLNSYTRLSRLIPDLNSSYYQDELSTNYGGVDQFIEDLSPRRIEALTSITSQIHFPVNYFYFVTNDNTLYLCITLPNQNQQALTDPTTRIQRQQNHQTRIFKILTDFTTEDKENIIAGDNWNNTPMLFWTENGGRLDSSLGSVLNNNGPFWSAWAKLLRTQDTLGDILYGYDLFDNTSLLLAHLNGRRFSKLYSDYGGRITGITTQGTVVQGGSYFAGAAVTFEPDLFDNIEAAQLRFIDTNNIITLETDQASAYTKLTSLDSTTAIDPTGFTGSYFTRFTRGKDNLAKVAYYNEDRAIARQRKVDSIRNATKIVENFYATAALTSTGRIYTWGNPKFGGDDLFNSVQRINVATDDFLVLNSTNQSTEDATDYVEMLPLGRGFLGFKTWDGSNNNVTFFGFFNIKTNFNTNPVEDYENFIANGKRYEPSDAVLLNDGGVILKAFGEDNYTIVGGSQGYNVIQGNFSAPSAGLTITKALCAWQDQRHGSGNESQFTNKTSLYLILWSDGTLQAVSFSPTDAPNRINNRFGGLNSTIDSAIASDQDTGIFQPDWSRWMDEEVAENRERIFTGVRDIFLVNQDFGFGYILENDDVDGYNTHIIIKKRYSYDSNTLRYYFEDVSTRIPAYVGYPYGRKGFSFEYDEVRDTGADIQDITTSIYTKVPYPVDTGFAKVRYKNIDYATSSCANPYSGYGPDVDMTQDSVGAEGTIGIKGVSDAAGRYKFTAAFLHTRQNFDTEIADNESNIIGIYWRPIVGFSTNPSNERQFLCKGAFVKHTRRNAVDSKTEDAGSSLFNFDYINLFVNQRGQLLSAPGIQFTNDDYWSNAELFLTGEVQGVDDISLSINNTQTINTFENCADSVCAAAGGTNHKCNTETGECFDCVPAGTQGYLLPSCDEVSEFFPWTLPLTGSCAANPCPPTSTVGCCCAYYQRTPEEPVWFLQQVMTIPANELTGLDQYVQQNGCFEGAVFQYYDGSPIPNSEINYTFTPFDDNFTELNCGAELWSNDFTQTCAGDVFSGANTFVSVDNIDLREPCTGNRLVDVTFTKRVQGLRCRVDYSIPALNSILQDIGCNTIDDSGTITFLENENEKTITLNLCCELTGTFKVSYTVSPVE